MEFVKTKYQVVCEVHFFHEFLEIEKKIDAAGNTLTRRKDIPVSDWLDIEVDEENKNIMNNNHLILRFFNKGIQLLALVSSDPNSDYTPFISLDSTVIKLNLTLKPMMAQETELKKSLGNEGNIRFLYGNLVARTFPDISKYQEIEAYSNDAMRYLGYLEINITVGASGYHLLDSFGKIKYRKEDVKSIFEINFLKKK
jgi:hypothetical protein